MSWLRELCRPALYLCGIVMLIGFLDDCAGGTYELGYFYEQQRQQWTQGRDAYSCLHPKKLPRAEGP